ncbi:MAG TPA: SMC-Scp complex subunit ScpB, partial [Bdellovibrionales bacterium]|nr:SMC-Scp complex subunit ScpB [Bdellovibrionales bacterium]
MSENEIEKTDIENPDAALENPDAALLEAEGLGEAEEAEAEVVPTDLEPVQVRSIIESVLLASDKPLGTAFLKEIFKGTNIKTPQIREALEQLAIDYTGAERGLSLVEVGGGYQLRTKPENSVFLRRMMKGRPFKLSGPALEVLAIIAYKQPIVKAEVDEIRGVESGHLMRALMDRGLIRFDGKSELPGKPMLYATTRKFLEIFGLKDLRELPTLSEIDQLIPEGIGDEEPKEEKLGDMQSMGLEYKTDMGREEE